MTMLLLDREFNDLDLSTDAKLDLRNIGSKVWPLVTSTCRTTDLRLYHLTIESLEGIERLSNLQHLAMEWARRVSDLSPVFSLRGLTTLSIYDFSKVRSVAGIEHLIGLKELTLSGNRTTLTAPMKLQSIKHLAQLPALTTLYLKNVRLEDDDITVLTQCENLRQLCVPNRFDRRQFAYLAKHLNKQLLTPVKAFERTNLTCVQCDKYKFMFTGRRMPFLCEQCDAVRFDRLVYEFEKLVCDA